MKGLLRSITSRASKRNTHYSVRQQSVTFLIFRNWLEDFNAHSAPIFNLKRSHLTFPWIVTFFSLIFPSSIYDICWVPLIIPWQQGTEIENVSDDTTLKQFIESANESMTGENSSETGGFRVGFNLVCWPHAQLGRNNVYMEESRWHKPSIKSSLRYNFRYQNNFSESG